MMSCLLDLIMTLYFTRRHRLVTQTFRIFTSATTHHHIVQIVIFKRRLQFCPNSGDCCILLVPTPFQAHVHSLLIFTMISFHFSTCQFSNHNIFKKSPRPSRTQRRYIFFPILWSQSEFLK